MLKKFAFVFTILLACNAYAWGGPEDTVVGTSKTYKAKGKETMYSIARKFDVGIDELKHANPGITKDTPTAGITLVIPSLHILPPKPYTGIVINKTELRLYYFKKDDDASSVLTFPITIGKAGFDTPLGETTVERKQEHPTWRPTPRMLEENPNLPEVVPPGPDNPLGDHAIYLGWNEILIHGTNKPSSIGRFGSHGCIRLYPEDIKTLFSLVDKGVQVSVIDDPIRVGWLNGHIYLAAYPPRGYKNSFGQPVSQDELRHTRDELQKLAEDNGLKLDMELVETVLREFRSTPIRVSK